MIRNFFIVMLSLFLSFFWGVTEGFAAEKLNVSVSIRPLHSIVAAVMGDTGTPTLIVDDNSSPHGYQLRPSQVKGIYDSDIVFYVGDEFETFLVAALENAEDVKKVELANIPEMKIYSVREGGSWEHGHHEHHSAHHEKESENHEHHDMTTDYHVWLDIDNASVMAKEIAKELSLADPENARKYLENSKAFIKKMEELKLRAERDLKPLKEKHYVVFHDAYQYFEAQFGLSGAGSITVDPNLPPSMRRIKEIRAKIADTNVVCIFHEPEFSLRLFETVTEGSDVRRGEIDPLGRQFPAGAKLYEELFVDISEAFTSCLGK